MSGETLWFVTWQCWTTNALKIQRLNVSNWEWSLFSIAMHYILNVFNVFKIIDSQFTHWQLRRTVIILKSTSSHCKRKESQSGLAKQTSLFIWACSEMHVCVSVFAESGFLLPRFHSQRVAKRRRRANCVASPVQHKHTPQTGLLLSHRSERLHYLHRPTQTEVVRKFL